MTHFQQYGTISEAVHLLLLKKKITVATCESCTGGALAAAFVSHAGASHYFQGSIVAYSNKVKETVLAVPRALLDTCGAVSEEVTAHMAETGRRILSSDCCIAVSGILGPSGGTPETAVGTICVSISLLNRPIHSWTMHLSGNRETNLQHALQHILHELYFLLK